MKRSLMLILSCLMLLAVSSQSYSSLWKQTDKAAEKDLPQTQIEILGKIEAKALREGNYGQLLKASLAIASRKSQVSPDSLKPAVERIRMMANGAGDGVLRAVYSTVIARMQSDLTQNPDSQKILRKHYEQQALSDVQLLATAKASDYEPFVQKGINHKIFKNDMLSVIGFELGAYDVMHRYYSSVGNRRAACIVALKQLLNNHSAADRHLRKSHCIAALDSLIEVYGNLKEAGEIAVERYHHMRSCDDVKTADLIKYINYATKRWPSWQRMNELRNEYSRLTYPRINIRTALDVKSVANAYALNLKNIDRLTMKVYSTNLDGRSKLEPSREADYKQMKSGLKLLGNMTVERTYMSRPDYELIEDTIQLKDLPVGVYMLEFTTSPATEVLRAKLNVSRLAVMAEQLPGGKIRYVAIDNKTGAPVVGARIELMDKEYGEDAKEMQMYAFGTYGKPLATLTADANGEAVYAMGKKKPYFVYAYTDADKAMPVSQVNTNYSFYEDKANRLVTKILTDRNIYRPGQTLNVAAISYYKDAPAKKSYDKNDSITLMVYAPDNKQMEKRKLPVDDFGKSHTSFPLPKDAASGMYRIRVGNAVSHIRVEEYKRPTFKVEFPEITEAYAAGDTLVVKGKAIGYNGMPVQGAKVSYSVNRHMSFWRHYPLDIQNDYTIMKVATTAVDGTFTVEVPLKLPEQSKSFCGMFIFKVDAYVTDASGESQHGSLSLPLGTKPVILTCSLPDMVLADTLKGFAFALHNAAGNKIDGEVEYVIRSTSNSSTRQLVNSSTCQLVNLSTLNSGRYKLTAWAMGDTLEHEFTVFSLSDTVPAAPTDEWFFQSAQEFPADGTPVTVQVGSSDPDLHIYYSIVADNRIIETSVERKNASLINRKLTYKPEYGSSITLNYVWYKDGKQHDRMMSIKRPVKNMNLNLSWKTFRNKLVPGQQEEWTLTIAKPDGTPADAQLVATMFDKALDQLSPLHWTRLYHRQPSVPITYWNSIGFDILRLHANRKPKSLTLHYFQPSYFDMPSFSQQPTNQVFSMRGNGKVRANAVMMKSATPTSAARLEGGYDSAPQHVVDGFNVSGNASDEETMAAADHMQPQWRENFSETAFFYPALTTDSAGAVKIKFTLPESVTTWRMMGFAHTRDMMSGLIDAEAISVKDVMVQPNVPRFVRVGDKAELGARISNKGAVPAEGIALMQLVDPETDKVVMQQKQPFSVQSGATASVAFRFSLADCHPLLICRITATGKNFSDGEQHYLPVLPNKELVTHTLPFTMNQAGVKVIELNKPSVRQLTLEYTDNPAWLVAQALPSMATPSSDNAIDLATALYVNQLRNHLASTLQLADSLANSSAPSLAALEQQLQKLQTADGSWSWCPGMKGNRYITATVVEMLARLNSVVPLQPVSASMLDKGLDYLSAEAVKTAAHLQKAEAEGQEVWLSRSTLQYLYVCAIHDSRQTDSERKACRYLTGILQKAVKSQNIYAKALTAIILAKSGRTAESLDYAASLKQYTVFTADQGRYYDTPRAEYSWCDYRIPTHVAAIEALRTVTPADTLTIREMQRWLLQQKRTQSWDTPINSINAIYAFISANEHLLDAQPSAKIYADGKLLSQAQTSMPQGYIKHVLDNPKTKTLTVRKSSQGTSWGAVYMQFEQPVSEIESHGSDITIKREIIAQQDTALLVGSRVRVCLTVESRRNLDFVQIVDKRAACMEPVVQLSGYRNGAYCSHKDNATHYFIDRLEKGSHTFESDYYIDRAGNYHTGSCTIECTYAPEFRATETSQNIVIK